MVRSTNLAPTIHAAPDNMTLQKETENGARGFTTPYFRKRGLLSVSVLPWAAALPRGPALRAYPRLRAGTVSSIPARLRRPD